MKKLAQHNGEYFKEDVRNIIVQPTLDSLQKQRTYHITQVEWHQSEITGLERQIRNYKNAKAHETVADLYEQPFKSPEKPALKSGGA